LLKFIDGPDPLTKKIQNIVKLVTDWDVKLPKLECEEYISEQLRIFFYNKNAFNEKYNRQ
jgi:hypothetical protein